MRRWTVGKGLCPGPPHTHSPGLEAACWAKVAGGWWLSGTNQVPDWHSKMLPQELVGSRGVPGKGGISCVGEGSRQGGPWLPECPRAATELSVQQAATELIDRAGHGVDGGHSWCGHSVGTVGVSVSRHSGCGHS